MNWPATIATITTLTLTATGCDSIPFFGGRGADTTATDTAAVTAQATPPAQQPATQPAAQQPAATQEPQPQPAATQTPPRQQPRTSPPQTARQTPPTTVRPPAAARMPMGQDEPWTPQFSGTVDPGMTADQVIATWGPPVAQRAAGNWLYLYFRNGCEYTCGTFDVVFLQDGQVVDAIVRAGNHIYSGVSSSPRGRPALFTAPGTTLDIGGTGT